MTILLWLSALVLLGVGLTWYRAQRKEQRAVARVRLVAAEAARPSPETNDGYWKDTMEEDPERSLYLVKLAERISVPRIPGIDCIIIMVDRKTADVGWVSTVPHNEATLVFADALQRILQKTVS